MAEHRGYYSVIQYMPDMSRREAANVGVLLLCPELFVCRVRLVGDGARVRQFFGDGPDWWNIQSALIGVKERLDAQISERCRLTDLQEFIALLANQIQMTPARPMRVSSRPEEELLALFRDLVEVKG